MYRNGTSPTKGDLIILAPTSNGSSAFTALKTGRTYQVESLGKSCSRCSLSGDGATVKVLGRYYCSASFVPQGQPVPANQSTSGDTGTKRDPARSLYASDVDWFDCLPDPTVEEYKSLPTLDELYEREKAQREGKSA